MPEPSFTAERVPERVGPRTLAVVFLGSCLALMCLEGLLRYRGLEPSHFDEPSFWSLRRARLSTRPGLLLVGSSRTQIGLWSEVLERALDLPVHQLSINGGSPFPVLEDLARSRLEARAIVVEFAPHRYGTPDEKAQHKARRYVRAYREQSWAGRFEHSMRTWCRERLVVLSPAAGVRSLLSSLAKGRLPTQPKVSMRSTGDIRMQVSEEARSRVDRRSQGRYGDLSKLDRSERSDLALQLRRQVASLKERGITVIFLRMPVCSPVAEDEALNFPSLFEEMQLGVPEASWLSVDSAFEVECVDGSHLTESAAEDFTRHIASVLRDQITAHADPPLP